MSVGSLYWKVNGIVLRIVYILTSGATEYATPVVCLISMLDGGDMAKRARSAMPKLQIRVSGLRSYLYILGIVDLGYNIPSHHEQQIGVQARQCLPRRSPLNFHIHAYIQIPMPPPPSQSIVMRNSTRPIHLRKSTHITIRQTAKHLHHQIHPRQQIHRNDKPPKPPQDLVGPALLRAALRPRVVRVAGVDSRHEKGEAHEEAAGYPP